MVFGYLSPLVQSLPSTTIWADNQNTSRTAATAATASAGAAAAAATATAILLIQVQPTFDIIVSPCNVGRGPAFPAAITCLLNMESVVVYDAASNLSRSLRAPRNYNDTTPNLTRSIAIDK